LIQTFTLKDKFVVLLLGICFNMILFNTDNFYNVKLYGHLFTPDETANFVAILDQMQTELNLVLANLENNNASLAQNHANKTASLLTPKIWFEIAEDNPVLAGDLRRAVNQLQNVSSSSESHLKSVSELVNDLNKRLEENAMVRIGQVQPGSSNFLEAIKSLLSIFGGNKEEPDQNTELQALAFADLIDAVLINYGNAFRVGFDMRNMSNMEMIGSNGSRSSMAMNNTASGNNSGAGNINMSMHLMNNTSSSSMTQHAGWTNGSKMPQIYVHYYGNESSESILEAYGLKPKLEDINKLKPVSCPNCGELNKIDSKFCVKCRMILSYDGYIETIQDSEKQKSQLELIAQDVQELKRKWKNRK
jgi:hypothetical protein